MDPSLIPGLGRSLGEGTLLPTAVFMSFSGGSDGKESTCNVEDLSLIPGLGRSSGEGHGNSLQYPCLENPMDRKAWQAMVPEVTKNDTAEVT